MSQDTAVNKPLLSFHLLYVYYKALSLCDGFSKKYKEKPLLRGLFAYFPVPQL